jgi:hypothetical protein
MNNYNIFPASSLSTAQEAITKFSNRGRNTRLTAPHAQVYAFPVAPHGRLGFAARHQSAKAITQSAFFVPPVYGGCNRGTLGCAAPLSGTANPVASATQFVLQRLGGGSQPDQRTVL